MSAASPSTIEPTASTAPAPDATETSTSGVRVIALQDSVSTPGRVEASRGLADISIHPEPPGEAAGPHSPELDEFRVEFPDDSQFFAGLSADACGGLFVATYRMLPLGTPVRLGFVLRDAIRVETRGVVRWIRRDDAGTVRRGMAIAFTDISPEALRHVAEFCQLTPPLFLDLD